MGRDRLFTLLGDHKLLIDTKKKNPKTTQSNHWFRPYPNLSIDMIVD